MSKHPWQAQADATRSKSISHADVLRILAEARTHWFPARSLHDVHGDEMLDYLELRLLPLAAGDPVKFRKPTQARWLSGIFEGPVINPCDPHRSGDVIVVTTSGHRVPVFLSSVRRRPS